jgi:hypothetical protein
MNKEKEQKGLMDQKQAGFGPIQFTRSKFDIGTVIYSMNLDLLLFTLTISIMLP